MEPVSMLDLIAWTLSIIFGLSLISCFVLLAILGNPHTAEPKFIKALRLNMWSEILGLLGMGMMHPQLFSRRPTRAEEEIWLPGDDLVQRADANATYAITIDAPKERIWPWLVQMGYGRALWYAWSPLHVFPEYKHHISPSTIHLEWQRLKVGDILLDGDALDRCSQNKGAWRVMEIHEHFAIVLFSARDLIEGIEFDPQKTRPQHIYGITSWAFYILPSDEFHSRLLIRTRAEIGPAMFKMLVKIVFGWMDAIFERTILEGIKFRVENYAET